MAFVRLAINPLDMPSFERVAGLSKGVGTKTAEKIYHVAAQGDFDALRKACTKYPDLWSDMLLLDKLREHNLTPAALIEMVIEHYTPRLQAIFPDDWPRRQQGLSGTRAHRLGLHRSRTVRGGSVAGNAGGRRRRVR